MWEEHDKQLVKYLQQYKKLNKQTQNKLQSLLDTFDINKDNLFNIADTKAKKRINTYIEEWKEQKFYTSTFKTLADNIYNKRNVKNNEILELLIYSTYVEEQSKLDEYENTTMYNNANYYYKEGQEEVNKTLKKPKPLIDMTDILFLMLLSKPNSLGWTWKQYNDFTTRYNANEIYRQVLINIQQDKDIEINSDEFQRVINKQINQKICINGDKISGAFDIEGIGLNNQAKIEGIKRLDSNAKVRFLADIDGNETPMCHSLNNQEFWIDRDNEFNRYYGETAKDLIIQKIKCHGLVLGLNLPPISHHFHFCRSMVQYLNKQQINETSEDEDFIELLDINNFVKKDITNQKDVLIQKAFKNEVIKKIALNNNISKIYIYGKKSKHKANNIYLNARWKNKNEKSQARTVRHEVGHAIDYKYNYISTKGEIYKALQIDKSLLLKNKEQTIQLLHSKEYKNYAELSDIISGLTKNKIKGKFYHSNKYWEKKNALEKETFANLFSVAGSNDLQYLNVIKDMLPNTLNAFDRLIRRIK